VPDLVAAPADVDPMQRWPHWREMLDVPKPEAKRLRITERSDVDGSTSTSTVGAAGDGNTLGTAIEIAQGRRVGGTRRFIPWPEADRPKT
jgi:hypothetical protein